MCNHLGGREYRSDLHILHTDPLTPEGPLSRFALIKAVLGPIMRLMFRPRVEGVEHIPGDGPVIWPATTSRSSTP